ncbi:MAG: glycosyltransferase family 4 protein [Bacilli bacterium]|nr:glycosyltransferase family 4 protein [Bacilli bacterium]
MRIGLFSDSYYPRINGIITSVDALKTGLSSLGHSVIIVTGGNVKKPTLKEDVLFLPSIDFNSWNCQIVNINSKDNFNAIKALNLNIIHSHSEFTIGLIANKVSKMLDIPNVHTYHTSYDDYKHYALGNIFGFGDCLERLLVDNFCREKIDALITPSEKISTYLKERYDIKKEPYIIKTGIRQLNTENFIPLEKILKINLDDFVVLYVGRIAKEKNIDTLIRCHEQIIRYNPNVRLLFVGDGPLLKKYKNYVLMKNIGEYIRFIGKVNYDSIANFYRIADMTAIASNTETQGLTILESLQQGVPIMYYKDEVFNYIMQDGYNGIRFVDDKDYIDKLIEIANNKEKLQILKNNSKTSVTNYNSDNYAQEVLKVYKKIYK